jgi:DNA-binding transcriptional LysR family regulator
MELYQLRYFLEAAKQQNFTRAAERLNLAQAALSEQMRKLEDELGTSLFHRGRRETRLTAAGETLVGHAEGLIERADAAIKAVQDLVGLRGGRLLIGTIPSASACLLPAAIGVFRKRHPLVELALLEGTSEQIAQWVQSGRVELGIVQLPTAASGFDEQILLNEPFIALVSKSHPAAKQRRVGLSKFSQESFILYKGRARDTALNACRKAGFEPRIACESGELETIRALVAAGLGVAILPELAGRLAGSQCVALRLQGDAVERQVALLSRAGQKLSPGAAVFREILATHC